MASGINVNTSLTSQQISASSRKKSNSYSLALTRRSVGIFGVVHGMAIVVKHSHVSTAALRTSDRKSSRIVFKHLHITSEAQANFRLGTVPGKALYEDSIVCRSKLQAPVKVLFECIQCAMCCSLVGRVRGGARLDVFHSLRLSDECVSV
jgi:hypothetical protein